METRERNSINYNNNNNPPQDSSPRLTTSNTRRRYATLNHLLHQTQPLQTTVAAVRYRECLKNHAANMGAHVLDGCGEFMPGGADDTPQALKCAACECHRSFHRREVEGESQSIQYTPHPAAAPPRAAAGVHLPPAAPSTQPQRHRHHRPMPPIMMAFGGAAAESSSEDFNMFRTYAGVQVASKKRFRTKFTQEQKDKMFDFAERIEWKIQKQNEQDVMRFCNEVGLKKQVFKVWMHNNKQAAKKK
ncbi:putative transcription factor ZF-HD family [Helianthus annuus]|nr:putative transcription factor ZF-HD family [Helianthus annuus]